MKEETGAIIAMAQDVIKVMDERFSSVPLELRIAAIKTAQAALEHEQARQVTIASLAKVFNNGR